jgi:hypothetical protein
VRRIAQFVSGLAVVTAALVGVTPAAAQVTEGPQTNKYLELLRQDLRTQKTAIVTEAMNLTDAQATAFWPIYEDYTREMRGVWDGRIANIKMFAENYERMTNDMAKQLADKAFKLDDQRGKVLKKYYGKVDKAVGPMLAARFVQIESALYDLISLQLAAELPLMK